MRHVAFRAATCSPKLSAWNALACCCGQLLGALPALEQAPLIFTMELACGRRTKQSIKTCARDLLAE